MKGLGGRGWAGGPRGKIRSLSFSPLPFTTRALREGGVVGVVEGPAPLERCLPPPERLGTLKGTGGRGLAGGLGEMGGRFMGGAGRRLVRAVLLRAGRRPVRGGWWAPHQGHPGCHLCQPGSGRYLLPGARGVRTLSDAEARPESDAKPGQSPWGASEGRGRSSTVSSIYIYIYVYFKK